MPVLSNLFLFFQNADRLVKLRAASEQNDLVAGLEFFIWARIKNILPASFDGDNARAGLRAQLQFANEFARRERPGSDLNSLQNSFAQHGRNHGDRKCWGRRLVHCFLQCRLCLGVNADE